jgi:anti-anti-sigma factor
MAITVSLAHVAGQPVGLLAIDGDVDIARAQQLADAVAEALSLPVSAYLVDLSAVSFMDCTGINALVALRTGALADGRPTVLVGASPLIHRMLGSLQLTRSSAVADSLEAVSPTQVSPKPSTGSAAPDDPTTVGPLPGGRASASTTTWPTGHEDRP